MKYKHKLGMLNTREPSPVVFVTTEINEKDSVWCDIGDANPEDDGAALQYIHKRSIKITSNPILTVRHPETLRRIQMQVLKIDDWLIFLIDAEEKIWFFDTEQWWVWLRYDCANDPVACMVPYAQLAVPKRCYWEEHSDQLTLNEWNFNSYRSADRGDLVLLRNAGIHVTWSNVVQKDYKLE